MLQNSGDKDLKFVNISYKLLSICKKNVFKYKMLLLTIIYRHGFAF